MFVHHVFFWLKNDVSQEQVQQFEQSLKRLLTLEQVAMGDVGKPSATSGGVIDNTYSYSLMLHFDSIKEHDAYQSDPHHEHFVQSNGPLWQKVLVYDSESI